MAVEQSEVATLHWLFVFDMDSFSQLHTADLTTGSICHQQSFSKLIYLIISKIFLFYVDSLIHLVLLSYYDWLHLVIDFHVYTNNLSN